MIRGACTGTLLNPAAATGNFLSLESAEVLLIHRLQQSGPTLQRHANRHGHALHLGSPPLVFFPSTITSFSSIGVCLLCPCAIDHLQSTTFGNKQIPCDHPTAHVRELPRPSVSVPVPVARRVSNRRLWIPVVPFETSDIPPTRHSSHEPPNNRTEPPIDIPGERHTEPLRMTRPRSLL